MNESGYTQISVAAAPANEVTIMLPGGCAAGVETDTAGSFMMGRYTGKGWQFIGGSAASGDYLRRFLDGQV